jgi:hypothetical protein
MINALFDHDVQLLIIKNNDQFFLNFKMQLSCEMWDDVFSGNDVGTIFNSFLNIYLRIFHSSFPLKKYCSNLKTNNWITPGIIVLVWTKI